MFASGLGYFLQSYGHITDIENDSLNASIVKTIAFLLNIGLRLIEYYHIIMVKILDSRALV